MGFTCCELFLKGRAQLIKDLLQLSLSSDEVSTMVRNDLEEGSLLSYKAAE